MPDSLIENLEHLAVKNDILFSEREFDNKIKAQKKPPKSVIMRIAINSRQQKGGFFNGRTSSNFL